MWKHRIWYSAVCITAVITYVVADRREPLVLVCILILLPLLGGILQRAAMRGLEVSCRVQGTYRAGREIAVRFELRKMSRLPLGTVRMRVELVNVLYGDQKETEVWLLPDECREMSFVYSYKAQDCGNIKIRVTELRCQDMLGLFIFKRPANIQEETLIYPPKIRLNMELLQRPATKSFGEIYDQHKKGQDISEVSGLRDYVPGDSINSIHWKLSGKMDRLIVREFGMPSNYNTLILYEMVKRNGEEEIPNAFNNAVLALTVSLSLGMLELNLEHNVGRIFHREFQTVPVYSMDTYDQMQMNLLCLPVVEEANGADMVYSFFKGNLRNEYTKLIYITPCFEEGTVRQLSREMDLTVIQVVQGKGINYMSSAGYSVVSVDVDTYQETMQNITI